MKLKKVVAAICAISMLASSFAVPKTVHASADGFTGTIDAFDMPSMEETRQTPKPAPSDPDDQPLEDWDLAAGLEQSAFRASNEYEITTGDIGYAWEAFDQNEGTRWQSGEKSTFEEEWIEADLGAGTRQLSNIEIVFFARLYGSVVVETSAANDDSAVWTELGRLDIPSGTDANIVKTVDLMTDGKRAEAERFVRLRFTSGNNNAANRSIAVKEIRMNGVSSGETVTDPVETANLMPGKKVKASASYGNYKPEYVNDGISSQEQRALRWQSGEDVPEFAPVWIQADLEKASVLTGIRVDFDSKMYGNFEIQTSKTGEADTWKTLETITDVPDGDVHYKYEKEFAAPLKAERFVRLYFTDVHATAANKSIAVRELELIGAQDGMDIPAGSTDAQNVINKITRLDLDELGTQVVFPGVPEDYEVTLKGSDLKQTISNDAIVTNYNFYDYDADVLVQVVNKTNPKDRAEKNMILHVPSRIREFYPELFPEVAAPNAEPKIIPSVQEWYGYTGNFNLTADTKIAVNDAHGLDLMTAAKTLQADIKEFTGWELAIVEGEGGVNDIELASVSADKYDTGKEGYILLNNDNGLKIYSHTYRGVFYGAMSVDQVFYQQRYDGAYSFPKGIMRDYPKFEVRGYMLDVARAPYRLERLYDYAKLMGFYKMNEFHVHLNDNMNQGSKSDWNIAKTLEGQFRLKSDTFPSLETVKKTSEYYNTSEAFGGQPQYTKEEYLAFQDYAGTVGVDIMSEIDLPGHSLLFNQYVENFPEEAAAAGINGPTRNLKNAELLALSGENYENAKVLMNRLWDEYLGIEEDGTYNPDKAVFTGDCVDIGADEYWGLYNHNGSASSEEQKMMQRRMLEYIQTISEKVKKTGKRVRVWGQLQQSADQVALQDPNFKTESLNDIELDFWYNGYENVQQRIDEGFKFVVVNDSLLYGNPARDFRDIVNAEYLFESWTPYITQTITIKKGEPGLLGAKTALWADINRMGVTERDINERIIRAASVVAEKTWGGTDEDQNYSEFSFKFSRLKNGPGVDIAKEIESKTDMIVNYDFANIADGTLYDISGNNYNAAITGTADGTEWMQFDGNTKITTPVDSLGYPYTVQFDIKADNAKNTKDAILFDGYDGRLSVDKDGNLIVDRSFFNEKFEYQLPADKAVNITLVGTQQVTKLYVDGVFVDALIRINNKEEDYNNLMGTFVFPLKTIGEGFHGELANIRAYKKAMNPQEVKDSYENAAVSKVNVSQNVGVAGELRNGSGGYDDGNQKLHIAWKAIDGDGNTLNGTHAVTESDKDSYFSGNLIQNAYIALDFYRIRSISEINLQFDQAPASYTLYTSEDGVNWTQLGEARTGAKVTFAEPVTTQYLKLQGSGFTLREMEVYEAVAKNALAEKVNEAEALVKELGLSYADKKDKAAFFDAYMNGVSALENAYALQENVDAAAEELDAALKNLADTVFVITVDGNTAATGEYNTKVTLTAPVKEGQKFTGWMLDGKVISTNPEYTFYIAGNMNFTTCYENVKMEAAAMIANVIKTPAADEKINVKYVAQLVIPEGTKIVETGLAWSSKNDSSMLIDENGTLAENARKTTAKAINTSGQFSITIKGMPQGRYINGVIYAIVKDADGTETCVFSEARIAENN